MRLFFKNVFTCAFFAAMLSSCTNSADSGSDNSIAVTDVALNQSSMNLLTGGTASTLIATISPANATNKTVVWTSSDSMVATVSNSGVVMPIGIGSVTISATAEDGPMTASCEILVTSTGVDSMVLVTGGTFSMGDEVGGHIANELPLHQVTVSSFYMSNTECTQVSYLQVVDSNPAYYSGNNSHSGDLSHPVEEVSWYDAVIYCMKRTAREGLLQCYDTSAGRPDWTCDITKNGYRLPTEAEWEYACKAGTHENYFFDASDSLASMWFSSNSYSSGTGSVSQKGKNALGLYDMAGNVSEWCNDWFASYSSASETNPMGPATVAYGTNRIRRGGSWRSAFADCRSSYRGQVNPDLGEFQLGFRVVRGL